ncbi:hypothetical protein VTJ04DRAFT_4728 [Mycothermus thermophilus]|uniref:uncharacterized protein n=1 Tax=Humicola insolens TaxID=85995 RepID=UPI003743BFF4
MHILAGGLLLFAAAAAVTGSPEITEAAQRAEQDGLMLPQKHEQHQFYRSQAVGASRAGHGVNRLGTQGYLSQRDCDCEDDDDYSHDHDHGDRPCYPDRPYGDRDSQAPEKPGTTITEPPKDREPPRQPGREPEPSDSDSGSDSDSDTDCPSDSEDEGEERIFTILQTLPHQRQRVPGAAVATGIPANTTSTTTTTSNSTSRNLTSDPTTTTSSSSIPLSPPPTGGWADPEFPAPSNPVFVSSASAGTRFGGRREEEMGLIMRGLVALVVGGVVRYYFG